MENKLNNQNNKIPPFLRMVPTKTPTIIRWIIIILFGIVPFLLLYWLVGTTDINNWRENTMATISYGEMWAVAIGTIVLSIIVVSLIALFSKEVNSDVIPLTVAFQLMCMGFYIIPFTGYYSLMFLFIAPMLFTFGLIIGTLGALFANISKMKRAVLKFQAGPEYEDMLRDMGLDPKNPKKSSYEEEHGMLDNPYVDLEQENNEEEDEKK